MKRFLQLHALAFFPPANMNRDDTGRPKTAVVGGTTRLRLSSQALKRAWRTSDGFKTALAGHMGERTQRLGEVIVAHLLGQNKTEAEAIKIARTIVPVFGAVESEDAKHPTRTKQLAFISPGERSRALALADRLAAGEIIEAVATAAKKGKKDKKAGDDKEATKALAKDILAHADTAADIGLFGRMLADAADFNREAAAQVAHAITTHRVVVEDDFYTAVDDLKMPSEDAGAGFLGEAGYGSGVFYLYACIDRELLVKNVQGDSALAMKAIGAFVQAMATVAPSGKQNSFAAFGRAHYLLAELGDQQPRTLAGAFQKAVTGTDLMDASVTALETFRTNLTAVYGPSADASAVMRVGADTSQTLATIITFAQG